MVDCRCKRARGLSAQGVGHTTLRQPHTHNGTTVLITTLGELASRPEPRTRQRWWKQKQCSDSIATRE
uniref:Uncharacterized protein n=1 Tax=Anopheles albimanus TaxID=7167 RepID=A0A182FYL4_ANOAL